MIKNLLLLALTVTVFSCNGLPSKSTAKELVTQALTGSGQSDGGSPVTVTEVTILSITKQGEKAKIVFTWSGVRRSPAIANPRAPEYINQEEKIIDAVKQNGNWVVDTNEE